MTHGSGGRWSWWRLRWAAAGGDADAWSVLAEIARTPGHPRREAAGREIAAWWAATHDAGLRQAVLDSGAVAAGPPARLVTLALHDRLDEGWRVSEAGWAPRLLADPDPDVRDRAAVFCRHATGAMHRALWDARPEPGSALREALLDNDGPPPPHVLDALWDEWIEDGGARAGDALLRWGCPADHGHRFARATRAVLATGPEVLHDQLYRAALLDALEQGDRPLGELAARKIALLGDGGLIDEAAARALARPHIAALCARHGLVPREPAEQAVFLLVGGQTAQYRALDPDGGLLALAYAAAPGEVRARIREALPAIGDLDLVRVIVGEDRRARLGRLRDGEARYLAGRLAERREWDGLWTLVQDLPLTQGIGLVRLFEGWAPRGEDARRLFTVFRETASDAVVAELGSLVDDPLPMAARTYRVDGGIIGLSLAPDGPFLAVAHNFRKVDVLDLRTGQTVGRYGRVPAHHLLHLGNDTVIVNDRHRRRLVRCVGGRTEVLLSKIDVRSLAAAGDGSFLVAAPHRGLLRGVPRGNGIECRPEPEAPEAPFDVVTHPPSGRFAASGGTLRVLGPGQNRILPPVPIVIARGGIAFIDADNLVLVTEDFAVVRQWVPGPPVWLDAHHWRSRRHVIPGGFRAVGVLPGTAEPVVLDSSGGLTFLSRSLVKKGTRPRHGVWAEHLAVAPGGEFLAVGGRGGGIEVLDPRTREVADLLRRPLADLAPGHLDTVAAMPASPVVSPELGLAVRLLSACLEHRFRREVELGGAVRLTGDDRDIGL